MKKVILLICSLSFWSWCGFSQVLSEGFEGGSMPPTGWTQNALSGTTASWTLLSGNGNNVLSAHGGSLNARLFDSSSAPDSVRLESPAMDLSGAPAYELNFWYSIESWGADQDELYVYYKTSAGGSWTLLASYTTDKGFWEEQTLSLPNLSSDYYVAFVGVARYGRGVTIDDITVATPPTCIDPSGLDATNITTSSADLSWTENGTATSWDVELYLSGTTPVVTPTDPGITSVPYNRTGLLPNSTYEYLVRSDCGVDGVSNWVGPHLFNTQITAPVAVTCSGGTPTIVFSDEMETATGWTGDISTSNGDWDFPTANPGGNSNNTGPSAQASGTSHAEFEATAGPHNNKSIVSPMIDLTNGTGNAELSFYMHAYGEAIGTLNVGVGNSATGPFTTEFTRVGEYQTDANDPWSHVGVDLSSYLGQQIYVQFEYSSTTSSSSSNYEGDIAIDLVQVETCVSSFCAAPSALTVTNVTGNSADYSWTENGSATTWDIEVVPAGVTPTGTPTMASVTVTSVTDNSLAGNTDYDYYVRADCGGGNTSTWAGPYTFTTPCGIYAPYYMEDFTSFLPDCWDEADAGNTSSGPSTFGSGKWRDGSAIGNTSRINLYNNNTFDWLLSPMFDLSSGGYEINIDVAVTGWGNSGSATMGADDSVMVVYSDNGSTWNELLTWTVASNLPNALTNFTAMIPTSGNNVQFGIYATEGLANDPEDYDFHIDNFIVRTPPSCPAPTNLTASNISNAADLGWTENGSATSWQIEWDTAGFTPGTGNVSISNSNPFNIVGLLNSTDYEFYVRAICGPGDTSAWSSPSPFTTPCGVYPAPYAEHFNAPTLPICWSESGDTPWGYGSQNGTTPSGFADYGASNVEDHTPNGGGTFIGMDGSNNGNNDESVLHSPMIDLTPLNDPHFSYWLFCNNITNAALNKLIVEVYDGANWVVVDSIQDNLGTEWVEFRTDLTGWTITGPVQARFTVTGDESMGGNTYNHDILIDDVKFFDPPAIDLAVIGFDTPYGFNCGLSSTEDITIGIVNTGTNDTANFNLSYQIDGGTVVTETVTSTLAADSMLLYTFTAPADLSADSTYNIVAWVTLPNDEVVFNDTSFTTAVNNLNPIVDLGNDTSICEGTTVTLDAGTFAGGYTWQDFSGNQTFVADTIGDFFVTVYDGNGCAGTDTVHVDFYTQPMVYLGNDTTLCLSDVLTLDAGSGYSYTWSDASTNQTLDLTSGTPVDTTLSVTITDANSCYAMDDIFVSIIGGLSIDLGMDTTICSGDTIMLDAGIIGADSYNWSTGETTQMIYAASTATYIVDVSKCGTDSDTIDVTVQALPAPNLGADQIVCWNDTVTLDGGSFDSYNWISGTTTQTDEITIPAPCEYTIEMYDDYGDGWHGNSVDFYVEGTLIGTAEAPDAGASGAGSGPDYVSFPVYQGESLAINHDNSGSFDYEISYNVYDGHGNLVHAVALGDYSSPQDSVWYGMANCPSDAVEVILEVSDAIGCVNSDTASVTFSNPDLDFGDEDFVGCPDETFIVHAGFFNSYIWSDGSTDTTLTLTNTGLYSVTVTDTLGCTKADTLSYILAPAPAINLGNDTAICIGSNFVLDAGNAEEYWWNTGDLTQTITVNTAGEFIVEIMDTNACFNADTINISTLTVTSNVTTTDATCGNSNGSATALATSGMSPYTYAWSDGIMSAANTALAAGIYDVTATDSYGCMAMNQVNILNSDGPQVSSTTITHTSCYGTSDGAISIDVTGGTTPHVFDWSNGLSTMTISGLSAGTYVVTVTDNSGCVGFGSIDVIEPDMLDLGATIYDVTCNVGSDGSIDADVIGGNTPFAYYWGGGITTSSISGLTAGNYSYTVTDANGCMDDFTVSVMEPSAITLTPGVLDATCNGAADGIAMINASGGIPNYTFLWNNGETSSFVSGLAAGTNYYVTATDDNNCSAITMVTLSEPSAITVSPSTTDATCGNADGTASVSATGGATGYTYEWSNNATTATITAMAGNYTATITDGNGCDVVAAATINNSNGPIVTLSGTDPMCNGSSDGTVTANVTGGATPFTFAWSNGNATDNPTGLIADIYDVTVTDGSGCTVYESTTLTNPSSVSITATSTDETTAGADDGTGTATASGGTSPYTYTWSDGSTGSMADNLAPNSYSVTTTDDHGCSAVTMITVVASNVSCSLAISTTATDASCYGSTDGAASVSITGATGSSSIIWSNGSQTVADLTGLGAGTYNVTVTDSLNCIAIESVTVSEPAEFNITLGPDSTICEGSSITLDPGAGFTSYAWSTGDISQTIVVATSGTYEVTVSDNNNCIASDEVVIAVDVCAGMDEFTSDFEVEVYPNPTTGMVNFYILAPDNGVGQISVYSVDGKLVYKTNMPYIAGSTNSIVDLTGVATGLYHVEFSSENETTVKQLIIK